MVNRVNIFGKFSRVIPGHSKGWMAGAHLAQGSQVLRLPPYSLLMDVCLEGGASHLSRWAALRGAVIKFHPEREEPVTIIGRETVIPSANTLMDKASFDATRAKWHGGTFIPHKKFDRLSLKPETFYLVHSGYCHPDQLFLPLGKYTRTSFDKRTLSGVNHMYFKKDDRTLFLAENLMTQSAPFNVLEGLDPLPRQIVIQLAEGGHVKLEN
jgi:hypothetical protein